MPDTFMCLHCHHQTENPPLGTHHRNHCPKCLWSRHVDILSGDRKSGCLGLMPPVALTFQKKSPDKYGKDRVGDILLVHQCVSCEHFSLNRISGDDDPKQILRVFNDSISHPRPLPADILPLGEFDLSYLNSALFGKK